MSHETSSADLPNSGTAMPKAGEERGGEMGEARDSLGVFLNDPSSQPKRASSVNIEDLDSEAGQAQKRMKGNGQEGGDSSGKDGSGSSSRSRGSRQKRSGIHEYVRPPDERVYCLQCTEYPEGFSADHELRRHAEKEHGLMWVIKDISDDKKFLSKCKSCTSGKKYGHDYNAAAHLRRFHFSEYQMRQQSGAGAGAGAGSGGGGQGQSSRAKVFTPPSFAELRSWIEEVVVAAAETPPSESRQPQEGDRPGGLDSEAVQSPRAQKGTVTAGKAAAVAPVRRDRDRKRGGEKALPEWPPGPPARRPLHPRVYCRQCTKCPNGFRSDHELRRHTEREHALTRKVWVIKDISEDKKFLSKCKACVSGKRYGHDYNAAAHLRRCHFSERKVRQQGAGDKEQQPPPAKAVKPPSMEELRSWIEEVEVTAETPPSESPQPPEGESAQQESATASKEAVEDPTPLAAKTI